MAGNDDWDVTMVENLSRASLALLRLDHLESYSFLLRVLLDPQRCKAVSSAEAMSLTSH